MAEYCYGYILDGHEPVPCPDTISAIQWKFDHEEQCRVARTYLGDGILSVSTVFLALNHNFERTGPPLLFETMVFDERTHEPWGEQWRTTTWDRAEQQHRAACEYVVRKLAGEPVPEAPVHLGKLLERALAQPEGEQGD